ncbi:MAG: phenylacetate--CoA ligase family protein [Gammaproteobacteria bacterium]|nr:phenylacetate--CoA ligase family protein [Gammaproteobacteria bacterium]
MMINRFIERLKRRLLSYYSANMHKKRSIKHALSIFNETLARVPAYEIFLSDNKAENIIVNSISSFEQLPLIDKKNYLQKYPIEQLCLDGTIKDKYLIEGSSGLSGNRSYWPRLKSDDSKIPNRVDSLFRRHYQIDQKPTLVIVGLMLGVWVSGEKMSWALRQIAMNNKYPLTIITPGANAEEIIEIIKKFSSLYKQTIIAAYPPFIKYLTDLGDQEDINWRKLNIRLVTGGEYFSEEWRDYMNRKLGHSEHDLTSVLGIYGASEMSTMMGHETPFSILVKKLAHKNRELAEDLFGLHSPLPALCQYNPSEYYIESVDNELVFSSLTAIPLVRYNIHDRGGLISFDEIQKIVSDHGYDVLAMLSEYGYPDKNIIKLPFLYVWGRGDGSALIYGAVIYSENIKAILDNSSISGSWTGLFRLEHRTDAEHNEFLQLKIELSIGVEASSELENSFLEIITVGLEEQNTDYRALRKVIGDKALLEIQLYPYQDAEIIQGDTVKHRYV